MEEALEDARNLLLRAHSEQDVVVLAHVHARPGQRKIFHLGSCTYSVCVCVRACVRVRVHVRVCMQVFHL